MSISHVIISENSTMISSTTWAIGPRASLVCYACVTFHPNAIKDHLSPSIDFSWRWTCVQDLLNKILIYLSLDWKIHIDGLSQDCSISLPMQRSYCSLTLSHQYNPTCYARPLFKQSTSFDPAGDFSQRKEIFAVKLWCTAQHAGGDIFWVIICLEWQKANWTPTTHICIQVATIECLHWKDRLNPGYNK